MSTASQPASAASIQPRQLLVSTVLGLGALVAAVAAVAYFARAPLVAASRMFVDVLGGFGVALGFFLPDAFTVPLPNDVVSVLGLAGGMSFTAVVAWGTAGSLVGGSVGYLIGRFLGKRERVQRFFEGPGAEIHALLKRYGIAAVAIAALTPLPYSIACWAAGAAKVRFSHFFLVSQLRIIRVAGYLYLIELGLVSTIS